MAHAKKKKNETEWPKNPPLPPREIDPTGEGDALRKKAGPGDDTVFEANEDVERGEKTGKHRIERSDEAATADEARTEDDAEHSQIER